MNRIWVLSVSIVFTTLVAFGVQEARAQTDTQFLNTYADDTRKSLPQTLGDVEITDARSACPVGCSDARNSYSLVVIGRMPQFAKPNISIPRQEQVLKPRMLQQYCGSPASQRNLPVEVHIYDMYGVYVGVFFVSNSGCPANVTPVQNTPTLQSPSQDAQFLNSTAADARRGLPSTIGNIEITDATSYCPAGCQRNYATNFIGLTGWTPRLAKQSVSIAAIEQAEKPQMLRDYCTSPARQRNVHVAIYVSDMYKSNIGVITLTPNDCANVNTTSNPASNNLSTSAEDQYWNAVKNSSRISDFQAYLSAYPYGRYVSIAQLRINQLGGSAGSATPGNATSGPSGSTVEDQYWDAIKTSNRVSDFQAYLNTYANGQYAAIARLRINQLGGSVSTTPSMSTPSGPSGSTAEDQYWDAVKNSSRPSDFQDYLDNYPNGKYSPIARLRITQLGGSVSNPSSPTNVSPVTSSAATVEQQYWDAVKNSTRAEDFKNYLRDYPNGQFAPIARLRISQLGSSAPLGPSNSTAEDQYWNYISNSQRAQDFQGYLYNYPNGKYAAIANLRISQLGGYMATSTPVVSAAEEQFWNNVKYSQRAQDFQDYLNAYPNGQYSQIARLRINQLTSVPTNTYGAPPVPQTTADVLATAEYGSLNELLPLRRVFVLATDLDSRDAILKELRSFSKLVVVGRKEDADFLVLFALTDQATGNNVVSNSNPVNQTYLGEMLVFSVRMGANGNAIPRILWRTKKTQFFGGMGVSFNRPPAVNAARDLAKELKKINY